MKGVQSYLHVLADAMLKYTWGNHASKISYRVLLYLLMVYSFSTLLITIFTIIFIKYCLSIFNISLFFFIATLSFFLYLLLGKHTSTELKPQCVLSLRSVSLVYVGNNKHNWLLNNCILILWRHIFLYQYLALSSEYT